MGKNIVKIISIWIDRHEKTGQTKIRLLLYVCDQGLHTLPFPGLPRSGKNTLKMKFFPGQGNVREFCKWSGKFRKVI